MFVLAFLGVVNAAVFCNGGSTNGFVWKLEKSQKTIDMPFDSDIFRVTPSYNAPQQVHITRSDQEGKGVIISWVTMYEAGLSTIWYWPENNEQHKNKAKGSVTKYRFYNYTSGFIHHCVIEKLEYDTKYYYELGVDLVTRRFWFVTPP